MFSFYNYVAADASVPVLWMTTPMVIPPNTTALTTCFHVQTIAEVSSFTENLFIENVLGFSSKCGGNVLRIIIIKIGRQCKADRE